MKLLAILALCACGKSPPAPPAPTTTAVAVDAKQAFPVDVAHVSGPGYVDADLALARVEVTGGAIKFDGVAVDGAVENPPYGMKMPKLTEAIEVKHPDRIGVAIDRHDNYQTLIRVLFSAKSPDAKVTKFAVYAKSGDKLVEVPIELPNREPPKPAAISPDDEAAARKAVEALGKKDDVSNEGGTKPAKKQPDLKDAIDAAKQKPVDPAWVPPPEDRDPKIMVSVKRDEISLWSISGLEGTLANPKLVMKPGPLDPLRAALAEIVARRFPKESKRSVIVQADKDVELDTVIAIFGAVRADANGRPLFDDIQLASSFER